MDWLGLGGGVPEEPKSPRMAQAEATSPLNSPTALASRLGNRSFQKKKTTRSGDVAIATAQSEGGPAIRPSLSGDMSVSSRSHISSKRHNRGVKSVKPADSADVEVLQQLQSTTSISVKPSRSFGNKSGGGSDSIFQNSVQDSTGRLNEISSPFGNLSLPGLGGFDSKNESSKAASSATATATAPATATSGDSTMKIQGDAAAALEMANAALTKTNPVIEPTSEVMSALNRANSALANAKKKTDEMAIATATATAPVTTEEKAEVAVPTATNSINEAAASNQAPLPVLDVVPDSPCQTKTLPPWAPQESPSRSPKPILEGDGMLAMTVDASSTNTPNRDKSASAGSSSPGTSRQLDLKHNDNAFHVVANLVVDRLLPKLNQKATEYILTADDIEYLNKMLQKSARANLVEAVKFRLVNCPPESEDNIHVLTRQCRELGLDRDGNGNPLLAAPQPGQTTITISNLSPALAWRNNDDMETIPTLATNLRSLPPKPTGPADSIGVEASTTTGPSGNSTGVLPPPTAGRPPLPNALTTKTYSSPDDEKAIQSQPQYGMPPQIPGGMNRFGDDHSIAGSSITGITETQVSTTESLARQQLMTELREASNLMTESVTPEAAKFWRQHVVELQARLRALHGEPTGSVEGNSRNINSDTVPPLGANPTVATGATESPPKVVPRGLESHQTPEQILEANQKLLAEIEQEKIKTEAQLAQARQEAEMTLRNIGRTNSNLSKASSHSKNNNMQLQQPLMDVVAPADLPEGFYFEAEIDGQRFLATVPQGGVKKGETFSCVMKDLGENVGGYPIGRWRDGLCDFPGYDGSQWTMLNALFCPLIALGQIMTRSKFDFMGRPSDVRNTSPFYTMVVIICFWIFMNFLVFACYNIKWSKGFELSGADVVAIILVNVAMLTFSMYLTAATRSSLREKYVIREQRCYDLEDCCCATFCMPCTICQMARHTADYNKYEAICWSKTGLPDNVDLEGTNDGDYKAPIADIV